MNGRMAIFVRHGVFYLHPYGRSDGPEFAIEPHVACSDQVPDDFLGALVTSLLQRSSAAPVVPHTAIQRADAPILKLSGTRSWSRFASADTRHITLALDDSGMIEIESHVLHHGSFFPRTPRVTRIIPAAAPQDELGRAVRDLIDPGP